LALAVSLIATIKNEGRSIQGLLDSLAAQTRPPDEIVLVDGGSSDNTVELIRGHALYQQGRVQVLVRPGANISQGRNIAIAAASHDLIASTDAGVRLSPNWLEELTAPFAAPSPPDVVSGFFVPDPQSAFETAMGATVLPALEDIDAERFWPSSRSVAYRKAAWQMVGGYPEWLDYCEDLLFDFRLKAAGARFAFAPKALVYFRPRSSLRAFYTQYYRYARGDGKADIYLKRHLVRYATYLVALPLLVVLGWVGSRLWWLLLALGGAAMLRAPYRRLGPMLGPYDWRQRLAALLWVPVIRVTGDVAKMVGYPAGRRWRRQNRASIPD